MDKILRKFNLHWITNLYHRFTRGVGCCDLMGYNYYLAKRLSRDLRLFKANLYSYPGYPAEVDTMEKWIAVIDKMIYSFDFILDEDMVPTKKKQKDIQIGLRLFGKYYQHLWL